MLILYAIVKARISFVSLIQVLSKVQSANIDLKILKEALNATMMKRGSTGVIHGYEKIMKTVRESDVMIRQWEDYQKDFEYAAGIEFSDICDVVVGLLEQCI